jgi:hypothetical protein
MAASATCSAWSGQGWNAFSEATQIVLSRWDLTRTAIAERVRLSRAHGSHSQHARSLPFLSTQWGGAASMDHYKHMIDDLMMNLDEQWRDRKDVHEDSLDVYFIECLEQYFNVDFENGDDSFVTEVSLIIQDLYRKCAAGELQGAKDILSSLDKVPSMRAGGVQRDASSGSESNGEEEGAAAGAAERAAAGSAVREDEGVGRRALVVDSDGWATVPVKSRKGDGGTRGEDEEMEEAEK